MSKCPKCNNETLPIEWCGLCSLWENPDYIRLKGHYLQALELVERLAHLASRLRLRSPATRAEIQVWANLREDTRSFMKGE